MATANTLEGPVLELVDECKIGKLLPDDGIDRWEASGIQAKGHYLYVIFDNLPHIARFHSSLKIGHPHHVLVRQRGASPGFEDITLNKEDGRFLIIVEARSHPETGFRPAIEEYGSDLRYLAGSPVDFPLESENKGMEGVAYVRRGSDGYLLGLCEGNKCRGGARGREPGGGRAYFNVEGVTWLTKDKIAVVSDKRKSGEQPKFAAEKDQSVHIFRIPR